MAERGVLDLFALSIVVAFFCCKVLWNLLLAGVYMATLLHRRGSNNVCYSEELDQRRTEVQNNMYINSAIKHKLHRQ